MKAKIVYFDLREWRDKKRIRIFLNEGYVKGPRRGYVQEMHLIQ